MRYVVYQLVTETTPSVLYRWNEGDALAARFFGDATGWTPADIPVADIVARLAEKTPAAREVTADVARKFFPEAF